MNKSITLSNIHEFKLSDIIESVIYDLQLAMKHNVNIDMSTYIEVKPCCTVCLGGAAACGFIGFDKESIQLTHNIIYPDLDSFEKEKFEKFYKVSIKEAENILDYIRWLFNELRVKSFDAVFYQYNRLTGKNIKLSSNVENKLYNVGQNFYGELSKEEIKNKLIPTLEKYVTILCKEKL